MNRQTPTPPERVALERIERIQTQWPLIFLGMLGLFVPLRLLPEQHGAATAIASVALMLGMVALLVYRACFLRCPRCSGWIAIPKCPGCGLKLDKPESRRKSASI
jgi:hypothetical protein